MGYLKREGNTISFYKVKKNGHGLYRPEKSPMKNETFNLARVKCARKKEHWRVDTLLTKNNKSYSRYLKPHYSRARRKVSKHFLRNEDMNYLKWLCTPSKLEHHEL